MRQTSIPSRALSATRSEYRGVSRSRIVGVAIDPAKTFHKVLIFDFNLDILEGPFDIDVLRSGLEHLLAAIERARRLRGAKRVVIGLEASGAFSWTLSRELATRFEHVYMFNPLTVFTARKGKLLLGQKTDAIDVAVIGDLLVRGQGYPLRRLEPVYVMLQELAYWRHHKVNLMVKLKQQIADRFEKLYPGITITSNGTKRLIAEVNRSSFSAAVVQAGLTPQAILRLSPAQLHAHLRPYRWLRAKPSAVRIHASMAQVIPPPESIAELELALLQRDFRTLKVLQQEIDPVEQQMTALVAQTPGRWLLGQLRGLTETLVATYIGMVGNPADFPSAKHVYSMAGLVPREQQSGKSRRRVGGVTKAGRKLLRTDLFQIASSVVLHEPGFRMYFQRLRREQKKPYKTALIATCNKLNRTLIALMRNQQPFRRGETA